MPWLDNKGILALEELPEHLLVLGELQGLHILIGVGRRLYPHLGA